MILEYRCKNFMSFEEEIEFTAFPDRLSTNYNDNFYTFAKNRHTMKSAVLFGENTGGKTNFIKSLEFLKNFIIGKIDRKFYKGLTYLKNGEKQEFYLKCLINNVIYIYELVLGEDGVEYEINYRTNLDATNETILYCNYDKNKLSTLKGKLGVKDNTIYQIPLINPFITWLKNNLIIELNEQTDSWINNLEKSVGILEIIKTKEFFEIFKIIDSSITDIEIDENKPFEYSQIIRHIDNNEEFPVDLKDDSMGVREFFRLSINLYRIIYNNCVVIADEVDKVLNVVISNKIIKLIHGSEHHGQFIFTTHNIMNLNTRLFHKSQIYFISKKDDSLSSELYSLADFKDFRSETKDVYKYYLKGMFGGTPNA